MAVLPQSLTALSPHETGYVESVDPCSGKMMDRVPAADPSSLPSIFERARAAQKEWSARPLRERCALIRTLRDAVYDRREEIVSVIVRETGKPRVEAIFAEILLALDTADFLARQSPAWLRAERVPHHNIAMKAKSAWLEYEPLGVVAVISPWNYPFSTPMALVIPALIAGNAVILKPSEITPCTGALIGDLVVRLAGTSKFPPALLQVVQGDGALGAALVDGAPDKMFFTGSVATGKKIAEACARKLIPSVLELGGKDAMIVLADANLEIASSAAVWGSFTNCGQACLSVERVYVEAPVAERFIQLCVEKTGKLRVGPASDLDVEIGPMIRLAQLERVERQLQDAIERGAKILAGGKRRAELGPNFFEPTVVSDVDHSMQLMRDETFGPVLAIQTVASADEALERANDSRFSLSASIWTSDAAAGKNLASHVRAGSVMINDVASYYGVSEAPHGGRGESGWGRTHSRAGLIEMVHAKYIDLDRLPRIPKPWWFGYTDRLAVAADRFVDLLFAPGFGRRMRALASQEGARGLIFRRDSI